MPVRTRRAAAALAATAALALLASACTGSADDAAADDPNARTTITFWHGWSAPAEVKAIEANVARFEKAHPNIEVKLVGGVNDDKLGQALRAGGSNGPDVVSSFTTSNVGKFCASGALADLKPFIEKSKLDLDKTFRRSSRTTRGSRAGGAACRCSPTRTGSTTTRTRSGTPAWTPRPRRRPGPSSPRSRRS